MCFLGGQWVWSREKNNMNRQPTQGVVLTGYHSNAELLAKSGPRAAVPPADPDREPAGPR